MLGLIFLMLIVAVSFGAGYGTRAIVSRKRREHYRKWEPYLQPSRRPSQPPAFLVQQPLQSKGLRSVEGGRVAASNVEGDRAAASSATISGGRVAVGARRR